jgi:hypothetical protein
VIFSPPPPPSGPLSVYLASLVDAIRRSLTPLISKDEAVGRVLLLSPSGLVYTVSVDDSGTLVTTLNDGKSRL